MLSQRFFYKGVTSNEYSTYVYYIVKKDFLLWIDGHVNWCDSSGKQFVDNINLDVRENFRAPLLPLYGKKKAPGQTSAPLESDMAM